MCFEFADICVWTSRSRDLNPLLQAGITLVQMLDLLCPS